ncbi:MAG: glycosyltransferase family 39 protein [Anaerolineales bacterium]|nr:glycosyltransferase family 39 protein [Anaerolineales bacterium]
MLILTLAAVALRARLLNSFPLSPDEGIHLMWLRLLSAGYQPYSEVYITYPPLYPLAINAVWQLWPTEAAQRWFSVLYTLFGVVGIALLARQVAGTVAGLVAAMLTLFSPVLLEPSRAILAEFPSVAWSVWAIWLAWQGAATRRVNESIMRQRILLILSGLCLSASLLTKLLSPFVLILIPLILIAHWYHPGNASSPHLPSNGGRLPPLLLNLFIWGLAVLLPTLVLISAFNINSLVRQVVAQRLEARAASVEAEPFWPPRYERAVMFVQEDAALVILGVIGIGAAWVRRQQGRWLLLAWLVLALGMLAVHNPIRYKHYLILIPPLAVFGGIAVAHWSLAFRGLQSKTYVPQMGSRKSKIIVLVGLMLLIELFAWHVPAALALWRERAAMPQPPTDEAEALAFIEAVTAPGDCLISDDMPLLYWSGRMTPPELAEVSTNRLESGALTTPELITLTDRDDCQLVAAVSNRIPQYLPDYMDWVKQTYLGRFHYAEDDLYFAKVNTDPRPATPLQADFDGQIIFHGYTLTPSLAKTGGAVSPGERMALTLVWQAQTQLDTDYAVFVQLRNAANTILASADHQPYQGLVPTSTWPAGGIIQEVTWLSLPPDLPPGRYNIYVGLYRPDNLERLPLRNDTSGENALILGPLVVQ